MSHRHDPSTWPKHGTVDKATQQLWKASLIVTVCNKEGILHKPLGKWLVRNRRWQHWYVNDELYRKEDQGWRKYKVISSLRTAITYTHSSEHATNKPEGGSLITDLSHCAQHPESTPPRGIIRMAKKLRTSPTSFRE
eukprot:3553424-Ditylum_brightwellii.AAC.1